MMTLYRWKRFLFFFAGVIFTIPTFAQCPATASCTPGRATNSQAAIFGMGIFNVTLGSINDSTAGNTDGYRDYSCTMATQLAPGLSYPVSIDTNPNADENVRLWIDYNNDGSFDPVGELFFSSDNARLHRGPSAVIPATATLGVPLRLRVAADATIAPIPTPCSTPQFSQTEDYSVVLAANTQPPIPAFSVGTAGACAGTFTFTDQSQRGPTGWHWNFGDGTFSTQQHPTHTYAAPGTYAVRLRACNAWGCDSLSQPAAVTFYASNPVPAACTPPTLTYCCGFGITAVELNNTRYTSADGRAGYEDFACTRRFTMAQHEVARLHLQTGAALQNFWVYLDLNNDGNFTTSEIAWQATGAQNPEAFFVVPAGALLNQPLRLRVVADEAPGPATPCAGLTRGQVEDYSLVVTPTTCQPQAGPPTLEAVNVLSDNYYLNSTLQAFVLSNLAPNQRVQWQQSPDGVPVWQDIPGATFPTYATTTTPANYTTQHRALVRCGTTTVATLQVNGAYHSAQALHQACSPTRAHIQRVRLAGTWLDNTSTCESTHHNGYTMYTPTVPHQTAVVQYRQAYRLEITTSSPARVSVFLTYFFVGNTPGASYPVLQAHTTAAGVPAVIYFALDSIPGYKSGALRLRVRCDQEAAISDAAVTESLYLANGETEDYLLRATVPYCTDPVQPGPLAGWQALRCPNDGLAVRALAPTPGGRLQWQTSPDSLTWTDAPGQTGLAYTGSFAQSQYLRLRVQGCASTAYSPARRITVKSLAECYCAAVGTPAAPAALPLLSRTQIAGTSLDNTSSTVAGGAGLVQYPPTAASQTATLVRGATYALNLTVQPGTAGTITYASAWLDSNADNRYDSLEWTGLLRTPTPATATTYRTEFRVPINARPGLTGLRLRSGTAPLGSRSSCDVLPGGGGETEEYLVTLVDAPCGPAPLTAGVLDSLSGSDCPYALRAQRYSPGATVQWQQSLDAGLTWADLPGATNEVYLLPVINTRPTEVRYRLQARCGSAVAYTRSLVLPAMFAPCQDCARPGTIGTQTCLDNYVDDVSLSGTTLNNLDTGCSQGRYSSPVGNYTSSVVVWPPQVPSYTGTVVRGATYTLRLKATSLTGAVAVGAWIDWDRNGTFSATEFYGGGPPQVPTAVVTVPVTVPANAALGLLPLKVWAIDNTVLATYGCAYYRTGETEFYYLSVLAQPEPELPTLTANPAPACVGSALQLQAAGAGTGSSYSWLGPASFVATTAAPTIPSVTMAQEGTYVATADRNGQRVVTSLYVPVTVCLATRPAVDARHLSIYPNPTTGHCTLRLPVAVTGPLVHVSIRTATGQLIDESDLPVPATGSAPPELALDCRQPAGLYFVEVRTSQGNLFGKVVVE